MVLRRQAGHIAIQSESKLNWNRHSRISNTKFADFRVPNKMFYTSKIKTRLSNACQVYYIKYSTNCKMTTFALRTSVSIFLISSLYGSFSPISSFWVNTLLIHAVDFFFILNRKGKISFHQTPCFNRVSFFFYFFRINSFFFPTFSLPIPTFFLLFKNQTSYFFPTFSSCSGGQPVNLIKPWHVLLQVLLSMSEATFF